MPALLDLFYAVLRSVDPEQPPAPANLNRRGFPFAHREKDLRIYQRWMARLVENLPSVILAIPMGLGKSVSVLTATRRLLRAGKVTRVLVVAPKRVAIDTWPDEICDWEHLADLTFAVCAGTPEERFAALAENAEITIINRENLQWLYYHLREGLDWPFDMLIYDESSRLKSFVHRSKAKKVEGQRTAKLKSKVTEFGALAGVREKFTKVVCMSGTPAPNGLVDLGGQAFIADGGIRLGSNKTAFLNRWFIQEMYTNKIEPRAYAEAQILDKLKDIMFSLKEEDWITLPPTIFVDHKVKFTSKLMREYKAFERTLIADAYDVEAVNSGVLCSKLLQWANGSLYRMQEGVENPVKEVVHVHDLKLDPLESILEEAAGQNVLLAYEFRFDIDRIRKRFPHVVVFEEHPDFVQRWKRGEIAFGAANPASIGHGLNLQAGGHIQVWFGLTWSLELYLQFNKRLARSGQSAQRVMIHRILAEGTRDESQVRALHVKNTTQTRINEEMKAHILDIERMAA